MVSAVSPFRFNHQIRVDLVSRRAGNRVVLEQVLDEPHIPLLNKAPPSVVGISGPCKKVLQRVGSSSAIEYIRGWMQAY